MRNSYSNVDARCPFYITSKNNPLSTISCEGIKEARSVQLLFHSTIDKNEHMRDCCANDYESCPIYRVVIEKYKEVKR